MHIYIHSFFFIRIYFIRISRHKAKAEILKRIDIILCVETSVNTIQNEKTCYSKMFNVNDSSMNGTCNTYTYTPINSKTEMS